MSKIPEYRRSNEYFSYFNLNPRKLKSASDCAIRAIGYVLGSWNEAYLKLTEIGYELKDVPTSDRVVDELLKRYGWHKYKQPRKPNGKKYTLKEFCEYCDGLALIRITNHITVCDNHIIKDTWDCTDYTVGNYWIIK